MLLVQEMIYTCNPLEDDERQKKEILVISENEDKTDSDPGTTHVYDKLKVKIPRLGKPSKKKLHIFGTVPKRGGEGSTQNQTLKIFLI